MAKSKTIKPEDLEDFELKFYEGMKRLGEFIADITKTKLNSVKSITKDNKLKVEIQLDYTKVAISPSLILTEIRRMIKHFPVFYTPAHYRPYGDMEANKKSNKSMITIIGFYE